ncbi:ROK family protein [Pararhodonellum marinum]|uniref:ROK family protein n=1 Tax=Pararhodonellum marinum TaxID=2755358 RepID=UPI00188FC089|nr:ROK family protein [Pararhodonellum marinum]
MILIADSGSSKTDWRVINPNGDIHQFRTFGFNPYYQTKGEMQVEMDQPELRELKGKIEEVYFYGAGCSTHENKSMVSEAIQIVLGKVPVHVDHDLMAAARATCGHKPGITCILGTGSNSCDYDGQQITDSKPSPGFILGDEGGGCHVGRKLLVDFIHDEMPAEIRKDLVKSYGVTNEIIQENVYKKPFPNRYMASFCKFISDHKSHPYCYQLFQSSFEEFFKKTVMKYPDYKSKPVNFVGSIAFHNSDILRATASKLGLQVHLILETPIAGLTLYHQEKI